MTYTNGTAISVGGESASGNVCCCALADAYKTVPKGAEYVSLRIKGSVAPVHNAEDVLIWVCKKMSLYKSTQFLLAMRLRQASWLKPNSRGMWHPYRIAHNCYVNMDGSGNTPLVRAAKILEWLAWPRADASLTYRKPPTKIIVPPAPVTPIVVKESPKPAEKLVAKKMARERVKEMMEKDLLQPDPEFDEMFKGVDLSNLKERLDELNGNGVEAAKNGSQEYDSPLSALLQERFSNGVRSASIIDQNKIRRAYLERYGKTLPNDMQLEQILLRIGILNDGKVFPRPNSDNGGWRRILERLIEAGHRFFYYSCVLESHAAELMSAGVTSVDMLKHLLEEDATRSFVMGRNAFSCPGGPTKVIEAIETVVGNTAVVLSEKDVCRKLPYVPPEEIHSVLAGDGTFFWNSPDTYVMPDRITFDEQEVASSLLAVRKGIAEREYYSLSQLDFSESAALNDPRITVFAYRKVFSARFLAGAFDVRGQIVCRSGAEIDGCFPLRDYCRSHVEITLAQFFEVAKEFNIGTETSLVTVYEEMVRVSKEVFVSPAMVTFDATITDADLARRCEQRVSSLNSIGDLSDFSAVPGYTWNRFLLDSYLRRASNVFAIRSISMPKQEVAGVIVRRDCGLDDVAAAFAEIAIGHGVSADAHEVGEFLVATRCTIRRGPALIAQVVSKMRDIYERKI